MPTTAIVCFVPVVGYVPGKYPNPCLGYELWVTNLERTVPYIFKTTLQAYANMTADTLGGCECMVHELYLHIPPFALYATLAQALFALGVCTPIRTHSAQGAAR